MKYCDLSFTTTVISDTELGAAYGACSDLCLAVSQACVGEDANFKINIDFL